MAEANWVRGRSARTLPHINDTILLISALLLAWHLGVTPMNSPWLAAKILALIVYIFLGILVIRPGRPLPIRILAGSLALVVFAYIVSVALTKHPAGFFASPANTN